MTSKVISFKSQDGANAGTTLISRDRNIYATEVNSKHSGPRHGKVRGSLVFDNLTWLTSNEAAEYLRLPSVGVLRVLVYQRKIPFHKLGRNLRFRKSELDRLLEASTQGGI